MLKDAEKGEIIGFVAIIFIIDGISITLPLTSHPGYAFEPTQSRICR